MPNAIRFFTAAIIAWLPACASVGPPEPVRFSEATRPAGSESFPYWYAPPAQVVAMLAEAQPEVQQVERTAAGN